MRRQLEHAAAERHAASRQATSPMPPDLEEPQPEEDDHSPRMEAVTADVGAFPAEA